MVSAKSGSNVVKSLYKTAGEVSGIQLSDYELAFYDTVLKVSVGEGGAEAVDEGRTEFADEIEAQDRAAMEAVRKRGSMKMGCCQM